MPERRWLNQAEAAAYVRLGIVTFRKRVKAGALPPGHLASPRRRLWTAEELDAALLGINCAADPDPIMAAINAAEAKAAAARGAQSR